MELWDQFHPSVPTHQLATSTNCSSPCSLTVGTCHSAGSWPQVSGDPTSTLENATVE